MTCTLDSVSKIPQKPSQQWALDYQAQEEIHGEDTPGSPRTGSQRECHSLISQGQESRQVASCTMVGRVWDDGEAKAGDVWTMQRYQEGMTVHAQGLEHTRLEHDTDEGHYPWKMWE